MRHEFGNLGDDVLVDPSSIKSSSSNPLTYDPKKDWWYVVYHTADKTPSQIYAWLDNFSRDDAIYMLEAVIKNGPSSAKSVYEPIYSGYMGHSLQNGSLGANDIYSYAGQSGLTLDPNTEKYIDNSVSRENTGQAQGFEQQMRDTSLISAGSQLEQLGLSPSNVVQVGGLGTNGVGAASNVMSSRSIDKQQLSMQKYQARLSMARSLLGMVGQMASSGIYGASIGAARNAASRLASATAHSGLSALRTLSGRSYGEVIEGLNNKGLR